MYARHEEAGRNEIADGAIADHRHIEIARAGTVGVKRRAVPPAPSSYGAAPEYRCRAGRHKFFEDAAELPESLLAAVESESNDVLALLVFRKSTLDFLVAGGIGHMGCVLQESRRRWP